MVEACGLSALDAIRAFMSAFRQLRERAAGWGRSQKKNGDRAPEAKIRGSKRRKRSKMLHAYAEKRNGCIGGAGRMVDGGDCSARGIPQKNKLRGKRTVPNGTGPARHPADRPPGR